MKVERVNTNQLFFHLLPSLLLVFFFSSSLFADKRIVIDLSTQTLTAKDGETLFLSSPISSGMYGHETPNGDFNIIAKLKKNYSTLYPKRSNGKNGGASMPYTLRITNDGVAIHAGRLPKRRGRVYPASHGCIRMPSYKSRKLFYWAGIGTPVTIIGKPSFHDPVNNVRKSYFKKREDDDFSEEAIDEVEAFYEEFNDWGESFYIDEDGTF